MTNYEMRLFRTRQGAEVKKLIDSISMDECLFGRQIESIVAVVEKDYYTIKGVENKKKTTYVILRDSLASVINRDDFGYREVETEDKIFRFFSVTTFVERLFQHNIEALIVLELLTDYRDYDMEEDFNKLIKDFKDNYFNWDTLYKHVTSAVTGLAGKYALKSTEAKLNTLSFIAEAFAICNSLRMCCGGDNLSRSLYDISKRLENIKWEGQAELEVFVSGELDGYASFREGNKHFYEFRDKEYKKALEWQYKFKMLQDYFFV